MIRRLLASSAVLGALAAASQATISFGNFVVDPAEFPFTPVVSGNALTWLPSDLASAGDLSAGPSRTVTFAFDATSPVPMASVSTLGQTFLLGTGASGFIQTVYALDAGDNVAATLGALTSTAETNTLTFAPSGHIRVVSSFVLTAPNGLGFDLAALTLVNQNVGDVPGPAAFATFAMAALGGLRRRRAAERDLLPVFPCGADEAGHSHV